MTLSPDLRFRLRGGLIHFAASAVIGLASCGLVLGLWYPSAYREISGGLGLLAMMIAIDVILGPLITFSICTRQKERRKLIADLLVIGAVQLAALIFGVHTLYQARPVALVFETHRMRVVRQIDLTEAKLDQLPEQIRPDWRGGPRLISTRLPQADETVDAVIQAFSGRDLGMRPEYWQPVTPAERRRWTDAAQPLSSLPQLASQPGRAERLSQEHLGRSAAGVKVLPVIARVSGWSMALDGGSGEVLGFLPID